MSRRGRMKMGHFDGRAGAGCGEFQLCLANSRSTASEVDRGTGKTVTSPGLQWTSNASRQVPGGSTFRTCSEFRIDPADCSSARCVR